MKRKGVTLIILIITILLIVILLGITMASVGNAVQNSRFAAFGEDLTLIEDEVKTYYIQNGTYPTIDDTKYTYNESSKALVPSSGTSISLNTSKNEYLTSFKQELISNGDLTDGENVVSDTVFYKIDLGKFGTKKTSRGNLKDGDNDIYVLSYPAENVYYVKGIIANKKIYYSLANISDVKKKDVEISTDKLEQNGVTVTKENRKWSNTLGININSNLTSTEKLYVKAPVRDAEIELSTVTGENSIDLVSLKGSLALTQNEVDRFNYLAADEKYLLVIKKQNGTETAKIKVDISNYDTASPEFDFELVNDTRVIASTLESKEGYNVLKLLGKDNASGIGKVYYTYYKKMGVEGTPEDIITDTSIITDEYMIANGKKASVDKNGNIEINIPKDIEGIYITMFDKAGNSTTCTKNVKSDIYVGINLASVVKGLKFSIIINSEKDITSAKASISEDGVSFADEKTLTLGTKKDNIYNTYVDFGDSNKDEVYIKVVATDNSNPTNTETRIKKIILKTDNYVSQIKEQIDFAVSKIRDERGTSIIPINTMLEKLVENNVLKADKTTLNGDSKYTLASNGDLLFNNNVVTNVDIGQNVWDGVTATEPSNMTSTEIHITSPAEFKWVSEQSNLTSNPNTFENYTIYLENDLDFGARAKNGVWETTENENLKWKPIVGNSSLNGNGHTIKGIYINAPSTNYRGLYRFSNGKFENITLDNSHIHGSGTCGGIIACLNTGGIIDNCVITDTVNIQGNRNIGGIAGWNKGSIINSKNNGVVEGTSPNIGGIVGINYGGLEISNCINNGDVKGNSYSVGGIIGSNQNLNSNNQEISNCINNGLVQGETKWIGGIIGLSSPPASSDTTICNVNNCTNNGKVTTLHGAFRVAGVVGNANNGIAIYNCINHGEIDAVGDGTASSYGAGGVVGSIGTDADTTSVNSYVYSCYNSGNVKANESAGGIIGNLYSLTSSGDYLLYTYNTGTINAVNGYSGGLIGRYDTGNFSGGVSNYGGYSYNNGNIKGLSAAGLIGGNVGIKNSVNMYHCTEGTNNYGVIAHTMDGIQISNVYFPSGMSREYGTPKDISAMDKAFLKSVLGTTYWNYDSTYPRPYKVNITFNGYNISSMSATSTVLE